MVDMMEVSPGTVARCSEQLSLWRESTNLGRRLTRIAPTIEQFRNIFTPSAAFKLCLDADKCLTGDYPTLGFIRRFYDNMMAPVSWLVPHLTILSEYSGAERKLTDGQLYGCAQAISREFYYLKVTELMLFFENYKNGLYGKFYGCVDPMSIMVSLREFTRWRSVRLDEIERGRVVEKAHRERMAWIARHKVLTNNEKSEI